MLSLLLINNELVWATSVGTFDRWNNGIGLS
jgi:hypothetical protein